MKKLRAFYFSGTGNTLYVTRRLCEKLRPGFDTAVFDISSEDAAAELKRADCILLAFPVYGSSPPVPMRRFLFRHAAKFKGKPVYIVATQYMFSGDGAASLGRAVEKCGGRVVGAEHFRMPNNLADCKIFRIKNGDALAPMLARTDKRIDAFAAAILAGNPKRRGFNPVSHAVGFCCQRALFRLHENRKKKLLKVDVTKCAGCGACVAKCPVHNLRLENGFAVPQGDCALCYRCINLCPMRAITLVGKETGAQYKGPPA